MLVVRLRLIGCGARRTSLIHKPMHFCTMKKHIVSLVVAILAIFTLTSTIIPSAFAEDFTGSGLAVPDEPIGDTNKIREVLAVVTNRPPDIIEVDGENPPRFVWTNSTEKISVERHLKTEGSWFRSSLRAGSGILAVGFDNEGYRVGFSDGDEKLCPVWEGALEKLYSRTPTIQVLPPGLWKTLKEDWTYVGNSVDPQGQRVFFLRKIKTEEIVSMGEQELLFGTVPRDGTFFFRKAGKWLVPVVERDGKRFIPLD